MEDKPKLSIPDQLENLASSHFGDAHVLAAKEILTRSSVNISFFKGTPDSYFICSGIVRDSKRYEVKVIFRKRDTDRPISSTCKCSDWTENGHCSHVCALFLSFYIMRDDQQDNIGIVLDNSSFSSSISTGVSVSEYGTIVEGPHFLENSSSNSAYSSMSYLLEDKRNISFPMPENFEGRTILEMTSSGEDGECPGVVFKYRNSKDEVIEEVSIFENLYLFDWKNGNVYYLARGIKEIVQKIRSKNYSINSIVEMIIQSEGFDLLEIVVDGVRWEEIKVVKPFCKIHISKGVKKGQLEIDLKFCDENDNAMILPEALGCFTFYNGILNTFKSKYDTYGFIKVFSEDGIGEGCKKFLFSSTSRNEWLKQLSCLKTLPSIDSYDSERKVIVSYESHFIISMISSMYMNFGKMFFRFSKKKTIGC